MRREEDLYPLKFRNLARNRIDNVDVTEPGPESIPYESTPLAAMNVENLPMQKIGYEPPQQAPIQVHIPQESDIWGNLVKALSNYPEREQYKPSTLRRVGAAVAGGGAGMAYGPEIGMETGAAIREQPYREAMQDWLTRTGALEKGVRAQAGLETARRPQYSGEAALINALFRQDPEKQAAVAGAVAGAKGTPAIQEFKFAEKLGEASEEDKKEFIDFLARNKRQGVERSTGVHLSVKDAQENNIPLTDRNNNPIDTSKLPLNMEYRMISGGPNGPYWIPDTQATKTITADNIRRTVPGLSPTETITSGVAIPPTIREVQAVGSGGVPIAQELTTRRQTGAAPTPITPAPAVAPPAPGVAPPTLQAPRAAPISQAPAPQVPKGARELPGFSTAELNRQTKSAAPLSTAMSIMISTPEDPQGPSLKKFAPLADRKESKEKIGAVTRMLLDNLSDKGGGGNVGVNVLGTGVSASLGGIVSRTSDALGLTWLGSAVQTDAITRALNDLSSDELQYLNQLFSAYGSMGGFRQALGMPAYKWSFDSLKREIPAIGISDVQNSKSYYNKLALLTKEINEGVRTSNISTRILPQQEYWKQQQKELETLAGTETPKTAPAKRYRFEEVK